MCVKWAWTWEQGTGLEAVPRTEVLRAGFHWVMPGSWYQVWTLARNEAASEVDQKEGRKVNSPFNPTSPWRQPDTTRVSAGQGWCPA